MKHPGGLTKTLYNKSHISTQSKLWATWKSSIVATEHTIENTANGQAKSRKIMPRL